MTPDGYVIPQTAGDTANARTDEALMDEATFQAFYRRHSRALWSYLCRMTGNEAHADDLVQDAFCKFLVAPVGDLDESAQRAYLFRIGTNLVIDQYRKRTREQSALDALPGHAAAVAGAGGAGMGVKHHPSALSLDMQRTFGELKPRERALLWLAYVEGSEHDEIAQSLGLKSKSIRVLLFRARHRLAALLRKKGLGGPDPTRKGQDPGAEA
jgi:RNA polymerase sigma-70 factor, ECF subfamily